MRALLALAFAALVTLPTAGAAILAVGTPVAGEVIVGYREDALAQTLALVATLGGNVLGTNSDLRHVVVSTRDVATFLAGIVLGATVEYAERNDATRMHGAQWNGAQWNAIALEGAEWDGAQWDGDAWREAAWDGARWQGARWQGAQWNGEQWDSGPAVDAPDPGRGWQWGLEAIRAPHAWDTSSGARAASLCVLDSGVDLQHADLRDALRRGPTGLIGFNAIEPGAPPQDDGGHGTHVAGIAAASIGNGFGVAGVANVSILPVKVLDANGRGQEDDLAAGLTWCANRGASVALMALGIDQADAPTVRRALEYAAARDVLLVASAGNAGCACIELPGKHKDVVAVGAFDPQDALARWSSTGPQLDLVAPGVDIVGPYPGAAFRSGSGTSQAAAFAAGAAALLRDHDGQLSASAARDALLAGARDVGATGFDPTTGHGALDVEAAFGG